MSTLRRPVTCHTLGAWTEREDVAADHKTIATQLVGELLEHGLEESLIYEDTGAQVVEYTKREELEDVEAQFFTAQKTYRRVRVYHSHTRAFVGVGVDGYEGKRPTWNFQYNGDGGFRKYAST